MSENNGRKDGCWKYAYKKDGEANNIVYCKYCNHRGTGGITRLKEHLAKTHKGVSPCTLVPEEVKNEILGMLRASTSLKAQKNALLREIGEGPGAASKHSSNHDVGEDSVGDGLRSISPSSDNRVRGTLDSFVSSEPKQTTLNTAYKKKLLKDVKRRVGRFIFSAALSFNVVNDPYWLPMVEGIAEYGKGFKPPSMHELRTWILREEVNDINHILDEHKVSWKNFGCTIMSDGWTDGKNRALMNFLVNSPADTFFLKSVDVSDSIKNGDLIFNYLNDVINEIGEENVVQIVTDNASNCKNAGKKIMNSRSKIWWTPCAAHCIDLMLEDIAKIQVFKDSIYKAKRVVKFIYGHGTVLALMRKFTNNRELNRPAVTRFATAYL